MIQWIQQKYDVAVIGGGTGGMGAAISAARHGAKTVLIQDRPVLGGNNSSEIRMHISGADQHALRKNARETGLVEEIALKNRYFNPQNSFCVSDTIYWEIAKAEKNLTLMQKIDVLSRDTLRDKLLSFLRLQLTGDSKAGASRGLSIHGSTVTLPMNKSELANYLNVNRTSLCRELHAMEQDGLLLVRGDSYTLTECVMQAQTSQIVS